MPRLRYPLGTDTIVGGKSAAELRRLKKKKKKGMQTKIDAARDKRWVPAKATNPTRVEDFVRKRGKPTRAERFAESPQSFPILELKRKNLQLFRFLRAQSINIPAEEAVQDVGDMSRAKYDLSVRRKERELDNLRAQFTRVAVSNKDRAEAERLETLIEQKQHDLDSYRKEENDASGLDIEMITRGISRSQRNDPSFMEKRGKEMRGRRAVAEEVISKKGEASGITEKDVYNDLKRSRRMSEMNTGPMKRELFQHFDARRKQGMDEYGAIIHAMQDMGVEFFSIKGKRIPIKGMTTLQLRELVQRYYK